MRKLKDQALSLETQKVFMGGSTLQSYSEAAPVVNGF